MKIAALIARVLLGLIFVVFGLNMWFHFIPIPPPTTDAAKNFMGAIYGSGYLDVVKVLEVTGGLALLSGRYLNLGLVLITPVVVNIFLYHLLLVQGGLPLPSVMLGCVAVLIVSQWKSWKNVIC